MSTLNCAKYAARWTVVRGCSDSAWCHIPTELSAAVIAAESGQETVPLLMVDGGVIQQLSLGLYIHHIAYSQFWATFGLYLTQDMSALLCLLITASLEDLHDRDHITYCVLSP